jgi:Leucine-rich repeat (LRR) protein
VKGSSGQWLGVEWDDPVRGKHDGSKDGIRYFSCRSPTSGSFIRPSAAISYGCTFVFALVNKYVEQLPQVQSSPEGGTPPIETVILGSSNNAIVVEAPDLNKVRRKLAKLENLRHVSLDDAGVSSAGPPGEIKERCPNIRGLDLSLSLISTWDMIFDIVVQLSNLSSLTLNSNRLKELEAPRPSQLTSTKELFLNDNATSWEQAMLLSPMFPALEHIQLGHNFISTLSPWPASNNFKPYPALQDLNLDDNQLSDWMQIIKAISVFPSLSRLVLSSNQIAQIPSWDSVKGGNGDLIRPLTSLKHLSLASNKILEWSSIDALFSWFPNLSTLSTRDNPITQDAITSRYYNQLVIARIPTLTALDGSQISKSERQDCELFYLSFIMRQSELTTDEQRTAKHPQFSDLVSNHGKPEVQASGAVSSKETLKNHLINIKLLRFESPPTKNSVSIPPNLTRVELKVLPTMTVRNLRLKILKAFKLPLKAELKTWMLLFRSGSETEAEARPMEMHEEQLGKEVEWWGLDEGSVLAVHTS